MADPDGRADGRSRLLNRLQSDVHDSARKERASMFPQVTQASRAATLPAEASGSWWAPRSSKPV
jgi:hypothetical protein